MKDQRAGLKSCSKQKGANKNSKLPAEEPPPQASDPSSTGARAASVRIRRMPLRSTPYQRYAVPDSVMVCLFSRVRSVNGQRCRIRAHSSLA